MSLAQRLQIPEPKKLGLALVSGLFYVLGLAPWDFWPISLLSVVALYTLLAEQPPAQAGWLGWAWGTGMWLSGAAWLWVSIHEFGSTSAPVASAMLLVVAVIMGFSTALQSLLWRSLGKQRWPILGFTALWVVFEWLRSWVLTGFPWLYLGYGFLDTSLAGFAPVGGVFMVSALALMSALLVMRMRPTGWVIVGLIWLGGSTLRHHAFTYAWGPTISVSIVQGNIPQDEKWQDTEQDAIIKIYRDLSRNEWGRDIVLWPEAAITKFYDDAAADLLDLDTQAAKHHSTLITGIPYVSEDGPPYRYYNSIIALGNGRGLYEKQRLVPFGEYIPFEQELRGLMPFFNLPMSSFSWGPDKQQPLRAGLYRVQGSICYEIAYPALIQHQAAQADFFVIISNDAWFGGSHGPWQHFEMVRMRALENGRYFLSGTNNGVSAIVDPSGHVVREAPQFRATVLRGTIRAMTGLTPWTVWGNKLILIPSFTILALMAYRARLQRRLRS